MDDLRVTGEEAVEMDRLWHQVFDEGPDPRKDELDGLFPREILDILRTMT